MKLTKLIVEGFLLFRDRQEIDLSQLPEDALVGVLGENLDSNGGYVSNASGKSSFLNILAWLFFDMIPVQVEGSEVSKDDVINRKCKRAFVEGQVTLNTGEKVRIQNIKTKSSKSFNLWINDNEYKGNTDSVKKDKFFSLIGIGGKKKVYFNDFLNSFYFSGELTKEFASKNCSDSKRMEIVSRFKKLEIWDGAVDETSKDLKTTKEDIEKTNSQIEATKQFVDETFDEKLLLKKNEECSIKIKELEEKVKQISAFLELKNEYNSKDSEYKLKEKELENIKTTIDSFIESLESFTESINTLNCEIKTVQEKINNFEVLDISKKDLEIQVLETKADEINKTLNKINSDLESLTFSIEQLELTSTLECPCCKAELTLNNNLLIPHNKKLSDKEIKTKQNKYKKLIGEKDLLDKEITKINEDKRKLKDEKQKMYTKQLELTSLQTTLKNKQNDLKLKLENENFSYLYLNEDGLYYIIKDIQIAGDEGDCVFYDNFEEYSTVLKEFLEIQDVLHKLEKQVDNNPLIDEDLESIYSDINSYKFMITNYNNTIKNQNDYLNQIKNYEKTLDELKSKKELYDYWSKGYKKIKNTELLDIEPQLEFATNDNLEKMGTNINVEYKVNVDSNGLSLNITEDSGETFPLKLFSQGQSTRIGIAAGLALRDIALDSNINIGFTLWDEVLDGLDASGVEMLFNLLKSITGLKFVISHNNDLMNSFEYIIKVIRKNNNSTIKLIQ
jgi:DNA repair exonuclease SbcCD ATPase subunit